MGTHCEIRCITISLFPKLRRSVLIYLDQFRTICSSVSSYSRFSYVPSFDRMDGTTDTVLRNNLALRQQLSAVEASEDYYPF